jgi:hypothetical protein
LGGAVGDTEKVVFFAGGPQAEVTLRPPDKASHFGVHAIRAKLRAFATLDAAGFVAPDAVLGEGVLKPATGRYRRPRAGAPLFKLFHGDCWFLCHSFLFKVQSSRFKDESSRFKVVHQVNLLPLWSEVFIYLIKPAMRRAVSSARAMIFAKQVESIRLASRAT